MKNFFSKNFLIGLATGAVLSVASVSAAANLPSISNFTSGSVLRAVDLQQIVQAVSDLYASIRVGPDGNAYVGVSGSQNYVQLNGKDPNVGIELRSGSNGGTPYIDFSNDGSVDFDGRLILLGNDILSVEKATLKTNKLQIGNKWILSGVGDVHSNDDWLRLFKADGSGYYGGLAADRLWSGSATYLNNLQNFTDNAAAKAAGAGNGQIYRTGDVVKVVHD